MPILTRLRALRMGKALSQRELATQARVTQSTIVGAERGADVRFETLRKLATALDVEPAELME